MELSQLIDLAYSTGCCHVVEEALNDSQLGRFLAENGFLPELDGLPDQVFDLLDFERIGREHRREAGGILVERTADHPGGYVERHGELMEAHKTLELAPAKPDYTILLEVSKGFFNDPGYDHDKTVQLKLPTSPESLDAALDTLGVWDWREAGWNCLDCRIPSLAGAISDEDDIHAINCLAQRLESMEPKVLAAYKALLDAADCRSCEQAGQLIDALDKYVFSPQFSSPIEVAKGELSVILCDPEREQITPFLNLYGYGQSMIEQCGGVLTEYGLIERIDGQPVQSQGRHPRQNGMEMK